MPTEKVPNLAQDALDKYEDQMSPDMVRRTKIQAALNEAGLADKHFVDTNGSVGLTQPQPGGEYSNDPDFEGDDKHQTEGTK